MGRTAAAQAHARFDHADTPLADDGADDDADNLFATALPRGWPVYGLIALGTIFVVITLDALLAPTSLITPIDRPTVVMVTAFCAAIGFMGAAYVWATGNGVARGTRATLGLLLGAPLLAGMWGNVTVWRLAEHRAFDFSLATWTTASHPITSMMRRSRRIPFGNYEAMINPYGAGITAVPITRDQYYAFRFISEPLCITVEQRRAENGAVQMRTDSVYVHGTKIPRKITRC